MIPFPHSLLAEAQGRQKVQPQTLDCEVHAKYANILGSTKCIRLAMAW